MLRRRWVRASRLEQLEIRRLLAAAVFDAATKTLKVTGTEQADTISITAFSDSVEVQFNSGAVEPFPYAQFPIQQIKTAALGGADVVTFMTFSNVHLNVSFDLGSGDDTFSAEGAPVTVFGAAGNDTITGGGYRDQLNGGDGNDSLNGGPGIDTVNGNGATDKALDDHLDSLTGIETKVDARGSVQVTSDGTLLIQGTEGADVMDISGPSSAFITINGTSYPTRDDGGAALFPKFTRVEFRGLGGDDQLSAGEPGFYPDPFPKITFDAGSGNDRIFLADTAASVIGGTGDDILYMRDEVKLLGFSDAGGNDTINAESWRPGGGIEPLDLRLYPTIENAIHQYSIIGNDLDNLLIVTNSGFASTVSGGKGNDILANNAVAGLIEGGDGNDRLFGADIYAQTLNGGAGIDTLSGTNDSTYLNGEVINPAVLANPVVISAGGNITVNGTEGADVISVLAWQEDFGSTMRGYAIVNNVPYPIETNKLGIAVTVRGRGGNDRIEMKASGAGVRGIFNGDDGNDVLIGGSYDDSLLGGNGDDTLDGRGGADLMQGGAGSDTADYSSRSANLVIGIGTAADDGEAGEHDNVYLDIEKVKGGSGNDRISGSGVANVLLGGKGNDTLLGNGGNDALFGQDGNDAIDGGAGNDYLDGGAGNDSLVGGAGVDLFYGWDGNDTFFARDNVKETLNGGSGSDKAQRDPFDILISVEGNVP